MFKISNLLAFLLFATAIQAQQPLHILAIKTPKELHSFFRWTGKDRPIISGHRGGMVKGFPENSMATFENTLKHTPAFFEIDPRLTKDSVIVLMHDATLERTTTGSGKVGDYTWAELKKFRLKDAEGNVTEHRIPTLAEAIDWARGKTILNLDKKDVPFRMIAAIIKEHKADAFVMLTVHTAEDALYYYKGNKNQMFSAFVKTPQAMKEYEKAGIPFSQMIAYIGPDIKPENQEMYRLLNAKGVMCMISAAPTYDKLKTPDERAAAYRAVFKDGASILESDLPIETADAIQEMIPIKSAKSLYFKKAVVSDRF
ncbi:glycerophosphodiester phosphodiesterase family protein [Larkinella humicola]|uniref:Glycerophosphodiester phosphodiesterase family protein n=1 Tax=Larkinella humicola TaxID=2607654 RepID=A0A5N1J9E4_9BACT|nr:glycerophosphodiester phosphodiesterase family protein [Larkinella humicola]KAA9349055.1 glycerophosphodiester phosphodiesterase family protein [Larkinella humicola]